MAKPPKSNVTQLRAGLSPEHTSHRILASIRCVVMLSDQLVLADDRQSSLESASLTDATKSYRALVREADELGSALTKEDSHRLLPLICAGLAEHDAIRDANKLAKGNRKAERHRVAQALEELHKPAKNESQEMLPITGDTSLGWFSDDTKAIVYTALLDLDGRGGLDTAQSELLLDLAASDLKPIAFVLDASEAADEDVPDDDVATEINARVDSEPSAELPV